MSDTKKLSFWHPASLLGTWFGAGLSPWAPGTVGSAAALPFAFIIYYAFGALGLLVATILSFFVGWWACAVYCRETGKSDPKEMVIDEVAGMWLTLLGGPAILDMMIKALSGRALVVPISEMSLNEILIVWGVPILLACVVTFFPFRLFDIWKPWPVSWADQKVKGGLGVMLDDILAAIYAILTFWLGGTILFFVGFSFLAPTTIVTLPLKALMILLPCYYGFRLWRKKTKKKPVV